LCFGFFIGKYTDLSPPERYMSLTMSDSTSTPQLTELLDYLFSLHRFGIKPGLERIESLLEFLGNPQQSLKCIHVAGTNGKGSVCSLLAGILQSAGYRVGLYTSPHLRQFNERIRINGEMISDADIAHLAHVMMPEIEREHTTFFEVTTAMAFAYFAKEKVDVAIIETGMGGRLDATNVIEKPLATVITSIDFDHTEYLGNDLITIAGEKAGIFKEGCPVIIGEERIELIDCFKAHASKKNTDEVFVVNELCSHSNLTMHPNLTMKLDCKIGDMQFLQISSDRVGEHQARNILTALFTVQTLQGFDIPEHAIRKGIAECMKLTGIKGRIQVLSISPLIVLDVGHNTACLNRLQETLASCGYPNHSWEIVFGVMKDKPIKEMLGILSMMSMTLHCCAPNIERAMPAPELCEMAQSESITAMHHESVVKALEYALQKNNPVLITGSFYLADEALQALEQIGISH
jgi:dihydrofolate synthase/folylpolyglutamate synthase